MTTRKYPHDIEAERSLLGAMLISKDICIDILNKTVEDDFMILIIKIFLKQWLLSMKMVCL